ncbi:unnamed protein product [Hermetia illucens]|uniref:Protein CDV3 homolog n=1 Tax=Hermetia illucens TaxID=343691 RepID=A0A7R8U9G9_HERIL|nr:protein CDV3 homolog isoform X1 [Hermetia illucens]CAD7076622.1 unnamed protein product [Hermetia illucens]
MADLDDFFAKKDKKKSKTKRFATAEELAKKLDDTSKRTQEPPKPRKDRLVNSNAGGEGDDSSNSEQFQRQEDEWKEFEEEERKDYTGLKIGQLTITDEEQNQANLGQGGDYGNDGGSDGEENTTEGRKPGPWKKVVPPDDVVETAPIDNKTPNKIYITPALRNQPLPRATKARNRAAPDITNEDYFPTLGAARPEEQRKKKNEPAFEEVRHGGRITRVQEIQSAPVSIGNRFKSLADDDS